jgi:cyclophilin family peptidyl-prolyl cis-trans isomerase
MWIHGLMAMLTCFAGVSCATAEPSGVDPPTEADAEAVKGKQLQAIIETDRGTITLDLLTDEAPLTVANFKNLADAGFYDGITFHRVLPDFMIQGGDPTGTGRGGPGYKFKDEKSALKVKHSGPGTLSMANAGPNTNGSQFFITHKATPWLDGKHAVFGRVVEGQDVVDAIRQGDTMRSVKVVEVGEEAA